MTNCELLGGDDECEHLKFEKETGIFVCPYFDGDTCRNGEKLQEQAEAREDR